MMDKRQYTPEEIIKVVTQVVATQKERNYKVGWVRYEMHREVVGARREGSFNSCKTNAEKLGWAAYRVAKGERTLADVREVLERSWQETRA